MKKLARVAFSILACLALFAAGAGDVPYPALVASLAVAVVVWLTW